MKRTACRDASVTVVNAFHWIAVGRPGAYVPMDAQTSLKDAADSIAATGVERLRQDYPGMTGGHRHTGPTALPPPGPQALVRGADCDEREREAEISRSPWRSP